MRSPACCGGAFLIKNPGSLLRCEMWRVALACVYVCGSRASGAVCHFVDLAKYVVYSNPSLASPSLLIRINDSTSCDSISSASLTSWLLPSSSACHLCLTRSLNISSRLSDNPTCLCADSTQCGGRPSLFWVSRQQYNSVKLVLMHTRRRIPICKRPSLGSWHDRNIAWLKAGFGDERRTFLRSGDHLYVS